MDNMLLFLLLGVCMVVGDAKKMLKRDDDLLLTGTQNSDQERIQKRKVLGDWAERLWPNGNIFYTIKPNQFNKKELSTLNWAMREWERNTCIKFKETSSNEQYEHYALFTNDDGGCYSSIGVEPTRNPQKVNLDWMGCTTKSVMIHELGHLLGLIHEHNRPDRDEYITMNDENIYPMWVEQLEKQSEGKTFDLPYDFQSVMHYTPRYFAKFDKLTFRTKDEDRMQDVYVENARGLSFTDVAAVNKMYKCGEQCTNVECAKPGFVDENCECVTPQNYADNNCVNLIGDAKCARKYKNQENCYETKTIMGYSKPVRMMIESVGRACRKFCGRCYRYVPSEWENEARIYRRTALQPKPKISECKDVMPKSRCEELAAHSGDFKPNWCVVRKNEMKERCRKTCHDKMKLEGKGDEWCG